ncbi:MAG: L-lactate dehydrogenase [Acetobacteraceae bacterium]|nr:L-lactate dehydrogenase [Acetobacteraceae bacterium]
MLVEGGRGRVGIVGTGMVGASFAYALLQSGLASEMVLVDRDQARAEGEAMDLAHGMAFLRPMRIAAGGFDALAGCAVVVVCAGANQRPGETRLDLLAKNLAVFEDVVPKIVAAAPGAIIVVATNPVDILTEVAAELAGLPAGRVLGSGTTLDTARLRYNLGDWFEVDPRSVHAWIVAEHGDTAVPVWSRANVAGMPLRDFVGPTGREFDQATMDAIFARTRDAAYEIIRRKSSTYYAIGIALLAVVEAVLRNQRTVLTVCSPLAGQFGVSGMALSLPTIVGRAGAEEIIAIPLDDAEQGAFRRSAEALKQWLAAVR